MRCSAVGFSTHAVRLARPPASVTYAIACQLALLLSACASPQPRTESNVSVMVAPVEPSPPAAKDDAGEPVQATPASIMGSWSEQWGIAGESDVEYHDEFVLERRNGHAEVRILSRDQAIEQVSLRDLHLSFVLHTDTLVVRYELDFQRKRDAWVGKASNDNGTFAITWSRLE
jgi:hypothetical protein